MAREKGEIIEICPRCGGVVSWYERQVKGNNVYWVAVHYLGRDRKGRKQIRKCYLGPHKYIYVERLNWLGLAGAVDPARYIRYLTLALAKINITPENIHDVEKALTRLKKQIQTIEEKIKTIKQLQSQK